MYNLDFIALSFGYRPTHQDSIIPQNGFTIQFDPAGDRHGGTGLS
jgi:hypothetical protein